MHRRQFLAAAGVSMALAQRVEARSADASPLNAFVADKLKGTDFGGTILVAAQGRTLLRQGYGLADRAFSVPCAADTAYRIASITKLFTATIVMRMWDSGRIDPDTTIATYLPGYKGAGVATVKVRHLLNHTSGIENFDKGLTSYAGAAKAGLPAYQIPHAPKELMDLFASGPLLHAPGTVFDYNNADYVILGQIVEAIEGISFDQVVARDITGPLAMTSTGMAVQTRIVPRLASTYYSDEKAPLTNDLPVYTQNWYAAGGMYSTVDDLFAFADALYGHRLLSGTKLAALLTPGLDDYGFGLWVSTLDVEGRNHRFAQRPGRIMGANTLLLRMLDDDVTVVILANTNLVDTDRLGFQIARQVIQAKPRN
jgi:D-alanyl-D-alanine carboxypeptidase